MATSKFLKWQDLNGDKFIDVCEDKAIVKEQFKCPTCIPDPYASIPNWKELGSDEPFFNPRTCQYQIAVVTDYETTMDPSLLEAGDLSREQEVAGTTAIFEEYLEEAVESLLVNNSKDDSDPSKSIIRQSIDFTSFDLDPRPTSRMTLLYSVPFDNMAQIEGADDQEDDEEDEATAGGTIVTYEADSLKSKLQKARKGLRLYMRYLKVFRAVEGGNILKERNNAVFNLQNYGDTGRFGASTLGSILIHLDAFLKKKNMTISGVGPPSFFAEKVTRIRFKFSSKYKLSKIFVYTAGCGEQPYVYGKKKLKSLNAKEPFKDATAMAYFAQLEEMNTALMARSPMPWLEFIKEFTYPPVYDTFPQESLESTAGSCIGEALVAEGKQLGQDLLDEAFSIGDALAYSFRKNICLNEVDDMQDEDLELGLAVSIEKDADMKALFSIATEQAYAEIEDADISFDTLCEGMLSQFSGAPPGTLDIKELWREALDELKLCGFTALILQASSCLLKGLTLEEALGKIVESAFKGMTLVNIKDFFDQFVSDEDRRKIDAMVEAKISSGDIFPNSSVGQDLSEHIGDGSATIDTPWNNQRKIEEQQESGLIEGNESAMVPAQDSSQPIQAPEQKTVRTLASQFDVRGQNPVNDNLVIGAYANAIVSVYSDDLLSIVDKLNNYPGGELVALTLAKLDCPQEPIMNPSIPDFIKSIELPTCKTSFSFTAPKFQNPFGWIPEIKDFPKIFFTLLREAIMQMIIKLIINLMLKICNILSGSVCKALETVGSLASDADKIKSGKENFKNAIRNGICGADADDETLNNTINDLFNGLGLDAAALSNQERLNSFMSDLSSATTQAEIMSAFMGEPSKELLTIVNNLVTYEYTEFLDGLPNKKAAGDFFKNVGNLFPASVKDAINNELDNFPADTFMPANPSVCATPEQVEDFCERRQALLSDRATAEQAARMCDSARQDMLDDLGDLSDLLQNGLPNHINNNMPPLVSQPGCDDGLIPFESEEAVAASAKLAADDLKRIKMAYMEDMLGNGPGRDRWGLINMVMSDTMGNPLTAHHRKAFFQPGYVDYHTDTELGELSFEQILAGRFVPTAIQRGAYPTKIAEWLQYQLAGSALPDGTLITDFTDSITFSSNNGYATATTSSADFDELGLTGGLYNKPEIKMYDLPDLGHDIKIRVDMQNKKMKFIRRGRKANADVTMVFKDNANGLRLGDNSKDSSYSYGFDIEVFFSEIKYSVPKASGNTTFAPKEAARVSPNEANPTKTIHNIFSDNVRVLITNKNNPGAKIESPLAPFSPYPLRPIGDDDNNEPELIERNFEFFAVQDTLDQLNVGKYTNFTESFMTRRDYIPQVVLLKEMASNNNVEIEESRIKIAHDNIMSSFMAAFAAEIANNEAAFEYGAEFDTLNENDVEYVLGPGYRDSGLLYGEAEIEDEDEDGNTIYRKIKNDDMIMGMSRMQYQIENENRDDINRVFYIDPSKFGGTFMNPPLYIAPVKSKGWMGLIDVLFPQITICKKANKDLINFGKIEAMVDERKRTIPIDERLKADDPDCVIELPYNKVLTRDAAANLEGVIVSAVRMFSTSHIIKSLATFTKFKIDFPNVFSDIYPQYIVESMEQVFSGADSDSASLSPFKDTEFWFLFLEQAVQMYGRRIDEGYYPDPPNNVLKALMKINDKQDAFSVIDRQGLKRLKDLGEVKRLKTLRQYRKEQKLNAIYETRDLAKQVLKQIIIEELNEMSSDLIKNMELIDMAPDINDLTYYLYKNFTQGSSLDLSEENLVETSDELPTEGGIEDQYAYAGEFTIYEVREEESEYSVGDEYIGYYHTHIDDEGNLLYMAGATHVEAAHNLIKPLATKMKVPIGGVPEYGLYEHSADTDKPFIIEKYVKINNTLYAPNDAIEIILSNDSSLNISDVYPGTMKEVLSPQTGTPIGITGELGVRYGLMFSIVIEGEKVAITQVEVDALDTTIENFAPFEDNSKLLLCLLNMLKDDNEFNLIQRYIFPLNKLTSILAIYNDMAFLNSIGQVTVKDGYAYGKDSEFDNKPGYGADIQLDDDDIVSSVEESYIDGWASLSDRSLSLVGSAFFMHWDEWDKQSLHMSKRILKRMFRRNYNSTSFGLGQFDLPGLDLDIDPVSLRLKNLRNQLKPAPGRKLLPLWRRSKLRSNPFDSDGNICEKE